jgi:hypothetical protein
MEKEKKGEEKIVIMLTRKKEEKIEKKFKVLSGQIRKDSSLGMGKSACSGGRKLEFAEVNTSGKLPFRERNTTEKFLRRRRRISLESSSWQKNFNPFISITPSKPLMSSGSCLTLHNCEIFYLSAFNYDPATTDLIFIRVNIYPGPGKGGSQLIF